MISCMEGENDAMGIASYHERSLLDYKTQLPVLSFLTTVPARNGPFWQQNMTQDRKLFITQLKPIF